MADPVEIAARAYFEATTYQGCDAETKGREFARTNSLYTAYIQRVFAALESAGFRIVSGETTNAMDTAVADQFSGSLSDWRQCWSDLIAAAPLYGKG